MKKQKVETLRWRKGRLEMIDQRFLPARFRYMSYRDAKGVAEGIRAMVVRGAPAIGVAAAYGVALEALRLARQTEMLGQFQRGLEKGIRALAQSRPTAVNLFWALDRMRNVWQKHEKLRLPLLANRLLLEARKIHAEDIRINQSMGRHGAKLLKSGMRVLTHCNAGALATAGHGTALGVIRSAVAQGKKIQVIADETRPFLQGARLTAWEMVQERIPVTLITDNMAGHLMARGEIDAVVVGTDRVAANGDVANKIGTYMVAVLARRHGIPFYVACPFSTIDRRTSRGSKIPIEERDSAEVTGFRNLRWAPRGVRVKNPAFDVTPASLVTALITEKGVLWRPNRTKVNMFFRQNNLSN
jgi:methylthioribose-1-phosphate isomerase